MAPPVHSNCSSTRKLATDKAGKPSPVVLIVRALMVTVSARIERVLGAGLTIAA